MGVKFYIGSLELQYIQEIPVSLHWHDKKFLSSVLPVEETITIEIREVEELFIPHNEGKTFKIGKIWQYENCEIRLYSEYDREPYLMSVWKGNHITIFAEKIGWMKYRNEFRPWFNIHLEELLLKNNALVLHSASIIIEGKAILFTAPSGTGKTTQTNLWHKYVDDVKDLNGDRTLLQKTQEGWCACGFPLYGSILRCEQISVPIAGIAIIRQSDNDQVKELSMLQKVSLLYSEITVLSIKPSSVNRAMDLIEDLVQNITVIQLNCTMKESAVKVLSQRLFGKEDM